MDIGAGVRADVGGTVGANGSAVPVMDGVAVVDGVQAASSVVKTRIKQ
jgi:hypothetical protein